MCVYVSGLEGVTSRIREMFLQNMSYLQINDKLLKHISKINHWEFFLLRQQAPVFLLFLTIG